MSDDGCEGGGNIELKSYVSASALTHSRTLTYDHTNTRPLTTRMHARTHAHARTRTHALTRTHTHARIPTHKHTHVQQQHEGILTHPHPLDTYTAAHIFSLFHPRTHGASTPAPAEATESKPCSGLGWGGVDIAWSGRDWNWEWRWESDHNNGCEGGVGDIETRTYACKHMQADTLNSLNRAHT